MEKLFGFFKREYLMLLFLNLSPFFLSAQDNMSKFLIGSWNTVLNVNGVIHKINWNILGNGQEVYYFTANGQTRKFIGYWSFLNGIIYEKDQFGNLTAYGKIDFLENNKMKVTVMNNGNYQEIGCVRYYYRDTGSNISFTGLKKSDRLIEKAEGEEKEGNECLYKAKIQLDLRHYKSYYSWKSDAEGHFKEAKRLREDARIARKYGN